MIVNVLRGNAEDESFITRENNRISRREMSALALIASGLRNEEGAKRFGVNVNTFRNHVYNVMQKLGAKNRAHTVVVAIQNSMLEVEGKRPLIEGVEAQFRLCMYCGRVFTMGEEIEIEQEPILINHVQVTPPSKLYCPYPDCDGDATDSVDWRHVREKHPEHPEKPERGKVYDFDFQNWYGG